MFLPVIVTVLIAAVVGALVVVQNQRQDDQVGQADAVAEAFLSDVGMFQGDVAREVQVARSAAPPDLRRVLETAIADPPELGDAPAYGIEQSEAYAAATQTEQTFLAPYEGLRRELRRADVALTFVAAARDALALRASDYVGAGLLDDSAPLRTRLIPAFVAARDTFVAVRVPTGQDELAATVRGALQYVIDGASTLAARIDADQSYTFTYTEQFQAAIDAVDGYATTVEGDLAEAVNAVTGTG